MIYKKYEFIYAYIFHFIFFIIFFILHRKNRSNISVHYAVNILIFFAFLCFSLFYTPCAEAGHSYKISGYIRGLSGEHKVYVSIYANEVNFEEGLAFKNFIIRTDKIKEGKAEYFFIVPEGRYLIMTFEDKNDDGKLNYGGFFNSPQEPYGYYKKFRPFLNAPSFYRLNFKLNKNIINANINLINGINSIKK